MKKILVLAIAAVAMAGGSCPVFAQTPTTTESHSTDIKTMPLKDEHKTSYDNVPQKVKDVARERVGLASIRDVHVGTLNGKRVYDLAYKDSHGSGVHQLRVTEDGKVIGERAD
jgi:hypothetical protein